MSTNAEPPAEAGNLEDPHREDARQHVQRLQGFYIHLGLCAASLLVTFVVNLALNVATGITGEWWAWWSGWALIGCTISLAIHGLVLRLSRPMGSTSTWEQQQIDRLLAEDVAGPRG